MPKNQRKILFLFFWSMKKKLTNMVSKVLIRLLNYKKQWIDKEKLEHAMIPCHSVFALLGAYIALSIMGWADNALIVHILRIVAIALFAWILVRFWDACAELLLNANKFMGKQLNRVVKSDPSGRPEVEVLAFGTSEKVGTDEK